MKSAFSEYLLVVVTIMIGMFIIVFTLTDKDFLSFIHKGTVIKDGDIKENFSDEVITAAKAEKKPIIKMSSFRIREGEGEGTLSDGTHYVTREEFIKKSNLVAQIYKNGSYVDALDRVKIYPYDEDIKTSSGDGSISMKGTKREVTVSSKIGEYSVRVVLEDDLGLKSSKNVLVIVDAAPIERGGRP